MGGDQQWTVWIELCPWRTAGGELVRVPLTIRRQVTEAELESFTRAIGPYAVLGMRARILMTHSSGGPQALLDEVVGADSNPDLHREAASLLVPIICEDALLGPFTLDRRVNWFVGRAPWQGAPVDVHVVADDRRGFDPAVRIAHTLWSNQAEWSQRTREFASAELLPLKNSAWLDEGAPTIDASEFQSLLSLESLTVSSDGSFEFWFDDGGLFWGHAIRVAGTLHDGPTDAEIAG